ncbi:MAG: Na+/H+ antiporter subunit C [Spirochaetia bacterium]|nr:Na+/H+ antiporter subunit C [Spirochaetia bacterium]
MINYVLLALIFLVGMIALITHRSIIKKIIALNIVNTSVVILFMLGGSSIGSEPPIKIATNTSVVDPMVHALMLTAIVIGVCVTSFSLALCVHLYAEYHTFDIDLIEKRRDNGD